MSNSTVEWFLSFIFIIAFVWIGSLVAPKVGLSNKFCESAGILCHHNDSNTNIYLRRILVKLDKILEQINKTPYDETFRKEAKEAASRSEDIIGCLFDQLKLLKSGKLQTGIRAMLTPDWLRNKESKMFDIYRDFLVCDLTEKYNYTNEEAEHLRKRLPTRNKPADFIEHGLLYEIRDCLNDLIEYEIVNKICEKNNYETPQNLWRLFYEQQTKRPDGEKETIIQAIKDGKITKFYQLKEFIRKSIGTE
jgi:hypothetical protein